MNLPPNAFQNLIDNDIAKILLSAHLLNGFPSEKFQFNTSTESYYKRYNRHAN